MYPAMVLMRKFQYDVFSNKTFCLLLLLCFSYYKPNIKYKLFNDMAEDPVICTCLDMCKSEIVAAIREKGLKTVEEVGDEIEAGAVCGSCIDDIQEILDEENN